MYDPTEVVLTGCFALAAMVFTVALVVRARPGGDFRAVRQAGDPAAIPSPAPPPLPPGLPGAKVPLWFYRPADLSGAALVFLVFSGLALASLGSGDSGSAKLHPGALVANIGFQFIMAGLVAVMVLRRTDLVSWLGLRWRGWPWLVLIAPGTVVVMWLVFGCLQISGYLEWMDSLGVETVQDTVKLLQESRDPLILGLMAFAAVVAAPLCEEIVFRGYLYPVLKRFGGGVTALFCSAMVFAAAHGSLTALLPLFIFGCVLVLLYEKTGSLWAPVAAHFCFNSATVLVQLAVRYYDIPIQAPQ
jgi:membrane protease YdiL (CAAX protease family)